MAFPLSSFQTSNAAAVPFALLSLPPSLSLHYFFLPFSSPSPLTFHSSAKNSAPKSRGRLPPPPPCCLPLPFSPFSNCWPGEQLTKPKAGAPGSGPGPSSATASSYFRPPSSPRSLLWPLALAPLSAAPAQPWPCLRASGPALPEPQPFPPTTSPSSIPQNPSLPLSFSLCL